MVNKPLEKGPAMPHSPDQGGIVVQPHRVEGLTSFLEQVNDMVGEAASERPSEQMASGGGAVATSAQGHAATGQSWRDQAIANLPEPMQMQIQLEQHIRTEVKKLRAEADHVTRLAQPGAAYEAAKLWAKIRRLNALLADILQAAGDAVRRLFIRVFIDRQPIL